MRINVHRCDVDGSNHEVVYQSGDWRDPQVVRDQTLRCVGIAVDVVHGWVYWSQKGASKAGQGRIFRARIDVPAGCSPERRSDVELLFEDLPEPIDLEIEAELQVLYWSDRGEHPKGNTLNRAYVGDVSVAPDRVREGEIAVLPKYDIITKHFHEAIGVKLDEISKCIWMTDIGGTVYKVGLDGKNKTKVYETEMAFTGIAVHYASSN